MLGEKVKLINSEQVLRTEFEQAEAVIRSGEEWYSEVATHLEPDEGPKVIRSGWKMEHDKDTHAVQSVLMSKVLMTIAIDQFRGAAVVSEAWMAHEDPTTPKKDRVMPSQHPDRIEVLIGYAYGDGGHKFATKKINRTTNPPTFEDVMDHRTVDNWKFWLKGFFEELDRDPKLLVIISLLKMMNYEEAERTAIFMADKLLLMVKHKMWDETDELRDKAMKKAKAAKQEETNEHRKRQAGSGNAEPAKDKKGNV